MSESLSTKPYFIRALYEWCGDNGYTPYLAVWVNEYTRVPAQFVQNNEIVLSISANATKDLQIDNDWISFHARFGGVSHELWIPVGHVSGIFAKETGEGMAFEVEPYQPQDAAPATPAAAESAPAADGAAAAKKGLKLVK